MVSLLSPGTTSGTAPGTTAGPTAGTTSSGRAREQGVPVTLRLPAPLRDWLLHAAARRQHAWSRAVTVQDVIREAIEALRAREEGAAAEGGAGDAGGVLGREMALVRAREAEARAEMARQLRDLAGRLEAEA